MQKSNEENQKNKAYACPCCSVKCSASELNDDGFFSCSICGIISCLVNDRLVGDGRLVGNFHEIRRLKAKLKRNKAIKSMKNLRFTGTLSCPGCGCDVVVYNLRVGGLVACARCGTSLVFLNGELSLRASEGKPSETPAPKTSGKAKRLAEAHWGYVHAALTTCADKSRTYSFDEMLELIEFHYISATVHGYGHGYEDAEICGAPADCL